MNNQVLAICLKTYPDEDDMQKYCDGLIDACDVKIYYKGKKYKVSKDLHDQKYYKLIETKQL